GMPFSTPAPEPRSRKTTFELAPAPAAITGRDGPRLRALLERYQGFGAIGGRDLALEELVFHFQAVELGLQAAVILARIVHQNIVAEEARGPAADRLQHPRQGRDSGDGPYADHAHVLIVAHLHRDQHELREDDQQQYGDIAVAIEQRVHLARFRAG